jgi:hypothetical protein
MRGLLLEWNGAKVDSWDVSVENLLRFDTRCCAADAADQFAPAARV